MTESQPTVAPVLEGEVLSPQATQALSTAFESALTKAFDRVGPTIYDEVMRQVGLSAEAVGLIRLLAAKSNQSKDQIIEKALTLYGLALDATEKGNKMAIITPDDLILRDINGIDDSERSSDEDAARDSE